MVQALYDPTAEVKICPDAVGFVLFRQLNSQWKAVAYASHSMSDTECRYSQIENEALAFVWSCQKFSNYYILGKHIRLETALIPLLSKASLDSLPPWILQFQLHLSRFDYKISHVPEEVLYTTDALSCAPTPSCDVTAINKNFESTVNVLLSQIPASADYLKEYQYAQQNNLTCSLVITYCKQGWPNRHQVYPECIVYWKVRNKLTIINNLFSSVTVLWSQKNFVPRHCRKSSMEFMKTIPTPAQPLLQVSHPWERIAADLFELKKTLYLLVVDYYSRFVEIQKLTSTTSSSIIVAVIDPSMDTSHSRSNLATRDYISNSKCSIIIIITVYRDKTR